MYDYQKIFVVGAVVFAILFTALQLFTLSSQVAEHHANSGKAFSTTADLLV